MNQFVFILFSIASFLTNNSFATTKIRKTTSTTTLTTTAFFCDYGANGCEGSCNIRNSQCGDILTGDIIYCGCLYCNFDNSTGTCSGTCPRNNDSFNSVNVCLNRIKNPKKDADCICASCQKTYDSNGKIKCSGSCFKSGLKCRVGKIFAFRGSYFEECFCQ